MNTCKLHSKHKENCTEQTETRIWAGYDKWLHKVIENVVKLRPGDITKKYNKNLDSWCIFYSTILFYYYSTTILFYYTLWKC